MTTLVIGYFVFSRATADEREKEVVPGRSIFGADKTVEYVPGTLPLIISAPHGGRFEPAEIPDRNEGVIVTDADTDILARELADSLHRLTGEHPHLVICHLKRSKVDCNRDALTGTGGNQIAMETWETFHSFIAQAREAGGMFFLDVHGHSHPEALVELGYQLSARQLKLSGDALEELEAISTLANLTRAGSGTFEERLRGDTSLGGLLEARGFPSVPSPSNPNPGDEPYFSGGYNAERYGSKVSGEGMIAVQVECPRPGVRDTSGNRSRFASAFAESILEFLRLQAGVDLQKPR